MARGNNVTLTDRAIDRMGAAPIGGRLQRYDALEPGLCVRITDRRAKSFVLVARLAGDSKLRKILLGHFPAMKIAEAREAARAAKAQLRTGIDPRQAADKARKADREAGRLARAGQVERRLVEFGRRHARKLRTWPLIRSMIVRELLPRWRGRQLSAITKSDVIELLDSVVDRGAPVAANRLLALVRKFFRWSVGRGYLERSPCEGIPPPTSERGRKRDRVLTDAELVEVWRAAGSLGTAAGAAIKLLILTGQRRGEVLGMRWSEIDLQAAEWRLPAERMKAKQPHVVPLSRPVLALLRSLPRVDGCDYVLTTDGRSHVSDHSGMKARLDTAILAGRQKADPEAAPPPPWRFHDLRRTLATGMAGLGVRLEVVEKVLHHVSGSFGGIVSVYQHHDFAAAKRKALEDWAAHVVRLTRERKKK